MDECVRVRVSWCWTSERTSITRLSTQNGPSLPSAHSTNMEGIHSLLRVRSEEIRSFAFFIIPSTYRYILVSSGAKKEGDKKQIARK